MIQIESLSKKYGSHTALDDVTLTVHPGDVYGLIGPNGSGKSTTMRILSSLIEFDSGKVQILAEHPSQVLGRLGILFEYPQIYPYLTGWEHLLLWGNPTMRPAKKDIEQVVERIGLQQAIHRSVKKYSLGMKQRLLLAVLLLKNPQVYLLDEPTNGLDQEAIYQLQSILKQEAERGKTILISSHTFSDLQSMITRIGILSRGKLLVDDNLDHLLHESAQYRLRVLDQQKEQVLGFFHANPQIKVIDQKNDVIIIGLQNLSMQEVLQSLYEMRIYPTEFSQNEYTLDEIYTRYIGG